MSDITVPNPTALITRLVEDLQARLAGYFLAGTGFFLALFFLIVGLVALMGVGAIPGAITGDERLLSIGMMASSLLLYLPGILLLTLVLVPAMTASLMRALWGAWRDGAPLGIGSAFTSLRQDLRDVVLVTLMYQMAVFVGALFCYVPGIALAILLCHAVPLVVLHHIPPMEALKLSFEKVKANLSYHVIGFLLMFAAIVVLEITVVGVLLIFPVQVAMLLMMHEEMFGPSGPDAESRRIVA